MFIVAASKTGLQDGFFRNCLVLEADVDATPPTHEKVFGPATEGEAEAWKLKNEGKARQPQNVPPTPTGGGRGRGGQNAGQDDGAPPRETDPRWFWVSVGQNILLAVVVLLLLWIFKQGMNQELLGGETSDERARNLITYLVSFGVIFIAILATMTIMFIRNTERFGGAKDVLTALIGILGTIIGFYYGTTKKTETENPNSPRAAQIRVSEPVFNPNPLSRDKDATVSFEISGGTPPYSYKLVIPEANANIANNSNGAVKETFPVKAGANVGNTSYSIEVTDAANKKATSKNADKIPIQ